MIVCKRLVHPDDQLQEASRSELSFARGLSIQMIICKRLVHPDDNFKRWIGIRPPVSVTYYQSPDSSACLSGRSFARGRSIQMIIFKGLVYPDDHLQEAGRSGWPFAWDLSLFVDNCCYLSLFFIGHCLLLVIVCICCLLTLSFSVCHCVSRLSTCKFATYFDSQQKFVFGTNMKRNIKIIYLQVKRI